MRPPVAAAVRVRARGSVVGFRRQAWPTTSSIPALGGPLCAETDAGKNWSFGRQSCTTEMAVLRGGFVWFPFGAATQ